MQRRQLSRKQIWELWPGPNKPNEVTLWRWLEQLIAEGRLVQRGPGTNREPFRYRHADDKVPYIDDQSPRFPW